MAQRGGGYAAAVLAAAALLLVASPAMQVVGDADHPTPVSEQTQTGEDAEASGEEALTAALELSRAVHAPTSAPEVVLGRADLFSDSLAAGSVTGQPVLLTPPARLDPRTAAELDRLGAERVTALGGPEALSPDVVDELEARGYAVRRLAGADRIRTALTVAREHHPTTDAPVILARAFGGGTKAFADALGGAALAHDLGSPIVLTPTRRLHPEVADYLAASGARTVIIAGGPAAVSPGVAQAVEELGISVQRAAGATRTGTAVAQNAVRGLDHAADAATVLLVDGYDEQAWAPAFAAAAWAAGSDTAVALAPGGRVGDVTSGFLAAAPATELVCGAGVAERVCDAATRAMDLPPFATVGGVTLHQPSTGVELLGFHQSSHDGARQLQPLASAPPTTTLESRERGTGSRSAADVVADPDRVIRAPVSGTVRRAGTYVLYCDHRDDFVVIEPDAHPGWEVKVLHIDGVRVRAGDRVEAGRTILAPEPTPLPFESQVDEHSAARHWPHVHLEVIDPSIPDRPSGSSDC